MKRSRILLFCLSMLFIGFLSGCEDKEAIAAQRAAMEQAQKEREEYEAQEVLRQNRIKELLNAGYRPSLVGIEIKVFAGGPYAYVTNSSKHTIQALAISVNDSERWEKIQGERQNGVRFDEMHTKMREKWLKDTGFHEKRNELYNQTHSSAEYSVNIPAGSTVNFMISIPDHIASVKNPRAIITKIVGLNNLVWPSAVEEIIQK